MLPPWLRRMKKRFVGYGATAPIRTKLDMESLEDRSVPATFFWTGGVIANAGGQLVTVDGNGNRTDNTRWSFPGNWSSNDSPFGVPQPGDDVVFPAGLSAQQKPPATGSGPTFVWGINSSIDRDFQIRNITILDEDFRIDAFAGDSFNPRSDPKLTITGEIRSSIPTAVAPLAGFSLIGGLASNTPTLELVLTGTAQSLFAEGPGVLKIAVPIEEPVDNGPFDTDPTVGQTQQVGLVKSGPGAMVLSGSSSFRGQVTVGNGSLYALHSSALGSPVNGTEVTSPTATLGVGRGAGDVGSYLESIVIRGTGNPLPVGVTPASPGALAGVVDPFNTFSGLRGDTGPVEIDGNINLASDGIIGTFGSDILVDGQITGGGSLTKIGGGGTVSPGVPGGRLTLTNKNAYTGQTFINAGTIEIRNNDALSSSPTPGTTTVAAGAALAINGSLTVPENLILNGTGAVDLNGNALGALRLVGQGAQATWAGTITLASDASIGVITSNIQGLADRTVLTLNGPITSAAGVEMSKVDLGTLRIPNANNNLRGPTNVRNGALQIANPLALGPAGAGAVTVSSTGTGLGNVQGTLQLEGTYTFAKTLSLNGQGTLTDGAVRVFENPAGLPSNITLAGPVTLAGATSVRVDPVSSLTVNAPIAGPGANSNLDKLGTGTLTLAGTNTYLGTTTLREGTTFLTNARGLGGVNGAGTVVAAGASLVLPNPLNVSGEQLTLSGVGVGGRGALQVPAGTTTFNAGVVLNGVNTTEADINVATGGVLNFSGVLSGDADLRKLGFGELRLTGTAPNQFVKTAFIDQGTLALGKTGANTQALGGPTGGAIVIGDGIGNGSATNNVDVLRLDAPNQIPNVSSIIIRETGLFDLNNNRETLGGLTAVSLRGGEIVTGPSGVLGVSGNFSTAGSGEQSVITGNLDLGGQTRSFTFAATPKVTIASDQIVAAVGETIRFTFDADPNPTLSTPSGKAFFIDTFTDPNGNVIVTTLNPLGTDLDVNGTAFIDVSGLVAGSHQISVQYSGDAAYPPVQVVLGQTQRIVNPPQRELLSVNANPAGPNQPIAFTYQVNGPVNTVAPTGTVAFFALNNTTGALSDLTNGTPLPLDASGRVTLNLPLGLGTGRYTVTARYSGDASYSPSTTTLAPALAVGVIPAVNVTTGAVPGNTTNTAAQGASSVLRGDTVRLTFRSSGAAGTPVGSVTFFDTFTNINGVTTVTNLGTGTLDATGTAFVDASFSQVGEHIITAEYSGDAVYTPGTATLNPTLVVSNPLTISLSATPNPVLINNSVSYVFRANGLPGQPLPTGRVTFFNTNAAGVRTQVGQANLAPQVQYDGSIVATATGGQNVGVVGPLNITADFLSFDDNYQSQTNVQALVPADTVVAQATFQNGILFQVERSTVNGTLGTQSGNAVRPNEDFILTVSSGTAYGRIIFFLNGRRLDTNDGDAFIEANPANTVLDNQPANGVPLNIDPFLSGENTFVNGVRARFRVLGLPPADPGTYNFSYRFVAGQGSPVASTPANAPNVPLQPDLQVIAPIGGILQVSDNSARENTPITLTYTVVVTEQGRNAPALPLGNGRPSSQLPTGTVTFRDNGVDLRDATGNAAIPLVDKIIVVNGVPTTVRQATLTLPGGRPRGTRIITALYSGDTYYRGLSTTLDPTPNDPPVVPGDPPQLPLVVRGGNEVQIALTSDANSAILGSNVTFTFSAPGNLGQVPATGTARFFAQAINSTVRQPIGVAQVLAGGVASVSTALLPVGVYRITADYSGDSNYTPTTATLSPNQRIVNPPLAQITSNAPLDPATGGAVQLAATPVSFTFVSRRNIIPNTVTPLATGDVQFFAAPIVGGVPGTPVLIGTATLTPEPTVLPAQPSFASATITAPGFASPGAYVISARYTAFNVVTGLDPNFQPVEVVLSPNLVIVTDPAAVPNPTPDPTIKPIQQPIQRLNGAITGAPAGPGGSPPGIIKAGVGTLTLNGVSTFPGATVQNSQVGSAIVLAIDNALPNTPLVITSGTVDLNGRNQTVTALSDDTAAGGSSSAGTLSFTGGGTLTVGTTTASTSTTYGGAITGTGSLVKNGTSTLTLSGNSPLFTGTITVNGGTLRVGDGVGGDDYSGADVTATAAAAGATGGTVGGRGTVDDLVLNAGTTLAPGAAVGATGTLTADNSTTFNGGTFLVDLTRAAAAGAVTGDQLSTMSLLPGSANPFLVLNSDGYNNPTIGDAAVSVLSITGDGMALPATFRFRRPDGSVIENGGTVAFGGRAFRVNYNFAAATAGTPVDAVTVQFAGLDVDGTLTGTPSGPVTPGSSVTYTLDLPVGVGGTVTFSVTGPGAATPVTQTVAVNGNGDATSVPITFPANGLYTVTAAYSGNATLAQKNFELTQEVSFPTAMVLSTSNGSTTAGQAVTFTATVVGAAGSVGTPTGTVSFTNASTGEFLGSAPLVGGTATLTTTAVAAGTNTIRAIYDGDVNFRANFADVIQTVTAPSATTTPFYSDAVLIGNLLVLRGSGVPGGIAVLTLPPGSAVFFTDVNGDGNKDVILLLPTLAVVLDGATGRLLFLFTDITGDGVRELIAFNPDGSVQRVI